MEDGWHHIAVVGSGGEQNFYVDGAFVGDAATQSCTDIGVIGNYMAGNQPWGKVTEVRLWNNARTQAEIQDNMFSELTGTEDGLIGYWKFNEGEGDTVHDSAGDNNGTRDGADWVQHSATWVY